MSRILSKLVLVITMVATALTGPGAIPAVHAGGATIHAHRIIGGLNEPVAFTFTPSGRIFYVEKSTGKIHLLNPANDHKPVLYTVKHVLSDGERGMLGIALHPNYPKQPFVWVYATRDINGHPRNQIMKLRKNGNHLHLLRVIWSAPAATGYHNGGRILFGPDGMLYAFVGDGHESSNAQDTSNNDLGKMLRMTGHGDVPADNPFADELIYSYGNRNSFGFTFDPMTDSLWQTENGPECNDEINLILSGENYGWGASENCNGPHPDDTNGDGPTPNFPTLFFADTIGITGAAFCDGCHLNAASEGGLFFGDVSSGDIQRVDLNGARDDTLNGTLTTILDNTGASLSLEVAPNGSIYYSDFSSIYRLVYN
jgi:glucose/arabinose dehydrogenase